MKDQFIKKAKEWDNIEWKNKLANEVFEKIRNNVNKSSLLVDIGGGTGLLSIKFSDLAKHVTIIDTSKSMLDILREKIKKYNFKNINIIEDFFSANTFELGSIDIVISMMTLHHIPDITDFFKSIYITLKKGGSIAFIDLEEEPGDFHMDGVEYYHNGFNINNLKLILEGIGFKRIDIKPTFNVIKKSKYGVETNYPILYIEAFKI